MSSYHIAKILVKNINFLSERIKKKKWVYK